ncbi:MAG: type II secretion system F family protein [bacterium]|nr:type II secretion system F family protein [bacterium]
MRFRYIARTKVGKTVRGALVSPSIAEAEHELADRGYLSASLRPEARIVGSLREMAIQFQRLPLKGIVILLRQLSVMVSAEMPLVDALRGLVHQTESALLRPVIVDLVKDVESGRRLSEAFAAHPRIFSSFAVYLVRAGETSGNLSEVISYLADQAERDAELRSKVRSAMLYPSFIIGGLVTVTFIMMTFVIPRMTNVLLQTGGTLPLSTQILITVSSFLATWWWLLLIVVVVTVVAFRWFLRYAWLRTRWDTFKLRVPAFGRIAQDVAIVRITQSFDMLLRGGVGILPSLDVVRDVVGNAAYRELLEATAQEVMDGNSLTTRFRDSWLIPEMVTQLLAVGERSGRLELVLQKLASHYERIVEQRIRDLITVIEPIVMIVLGIGVGVMVGAIILPMYNLVSQF